MGLAQLAATEASPPFGPSLQIPPEWVPFSVSARGPGWGSRTAEVPESPLSPPTEGFFKTPSCTPRSPSTCDNPGFYPKESSANR